MFEGPTNLRMITLKIILLAATVPSILSDMLPPSCERPVYCNSNLLHHVQMARVYKDSKTFVDLKMKYIETTILSQFDLLLIVTNNTPSNEQLLAFINTHFDNTTEFEKWTPTDYKPNPPFLASVKDKRLRNFGRKINDIWPTLGRRMNAVVHKNPELFSIIPVHHGFIIPGGRFRELYYWDTYWIVQGLLISGMKDTVKGIISNFVELQRKFGHIPNGARWYYQKRSQPPLLSAMVKLYLRDTNDTAFLRKIIDSLENEAEYWLETHTKTFKVNNSEYTMLRYYSTSEGPRPESYYEDYNNAKVFSAEDEKRNFYNNIKSGAESGWDFSTRWFVDENGKNSGNLSTIHTTQIIPVDLNAIFASVLQNLAHFHVLLRNPRKGAHWAYLAKQWRNNIKAVLWNEEDSIWYDWDFEESQHRKYFYPSNVAPLWMQVVDKSFVKVKGNAIINYLKANQVLDPFRYPGGVPTSLIHSGEQWDFPNAWPPLISLMVSALEALEMPEANYLAFNVAQTWIHSNYEGFQKGKGMFEKYHVEKPGKIGLGGEYEGQIGFGWSNGVVLEMLSKYGTKLRVDKFSKGFSVSND